MARLNNANTKVRKGSGPLSTTGQVVQNPEGGLGYKRDPRSELFLATVTSLNEDTFYETAEERQNRIALETAYNGHDRVILLTDEQNGYFGYNRYYNSGTVDVFEGVVPTNVPTFTWNLAGYEAAQAVNKPGRFTFGGLSDKGFQMIPLIERGFDTGWPWEK